MSIVLNVPYIHQLRNTPDEFNGNWACGPTSTVMALAAYGLLTARSDPYGQYGWYISNSYNASDGFSFTHQEADTSGRGAAGAYGHCTRDGMCYGQRAADFAARHGLKGQSVTPSQNAVAAQIRAGKPVVLGTTLKGFGHVILVKGITDDGRFICNDPYWRKPGAGDDVYSWGELGFCPFMLSFDRALPSQAPAPVAAAKPVAAPAPAPAPANVAHAPTAAMTLGQGLPALDMQRFIDAFARNGGADKLGMPTNPPRQQDGIWMQDCPKGAVIILDTSKDDKGAANLAILQPAFVVYDPILRKWRDNYGGKTGPLGSPLSDIFTNTQGLQQCSFEGGYITWDDNSPDANDAYVWPAQFNTWKAEYFNNPGLAGSLAYIRDEPEINYDFGDWGPEGGKLGILSNMFSVRWTRMDNFEDGDYVFTVTADDGFRILVDGQSVTENPNAFWHISAAQENSFPRTMTAGQHEIRLEYFEAGGKAVIKFNYAKK